MTPASPFLAGAKRAIGDDGDTQSIAPPVISNDSIADSNLFRYLSAMPSEQAPSPKKNFIRRFFSVLGPGLITGAADDDPSGVATYSIAGAQLGTSLLWSAFITWPLMGCVQFMCARIGMVTGQGLGAAFRQIFPRWVLGIASLALLAANTINVGADLAVCRTPPRCSVV